MITNLLSNCTIYPNSCTQVFVIMESFNSMPVFRIFWEISYLFHYVISLGKKLEAHIVAIVLLKANYINNKKCIQVHIYNKHKSLKAKCKFKQRSKNPHTKLSWSVPIAGCSANLLMSFKGERTDLPPKSNKVPYCPRKEKWKQHTYK